MSESVPTDGKAALDNLLSRNLRFVEGQPGQVTQIGKRRAELVGGQQPFAVIVACADSRVAPELVFDSGLGELFVIRVAGNIANTSTVASVEYAVAHLGVRLVMVLGHQSCGAVAAAIAGGDNGANLNHLVDHIKPAVSDADPDDVSKRNAVINAAALVETSDILTQAKTAGQLEVVPAFYSLVSGRVTVVGDSA